ncbi:anti-sigma factor [Microbacterium sp. MAHUQ-60]|uniref:anti-sigma factor n=1 Tax=unclassified Microbacterium TaxID=2609290 RepID=UPI00360CEC20
MNEQEFQQLAAGHALHALSAADERRFALAGAEHPEWTSDADRDVETAAALAAALEPVRPPSALRDALLAQISTTPQDPEAQDPEAQNPGAQEVRADGRVDAAAVRTSPTTRSTGGPRRWSRALFTLAACLVLLVGGGIATAIVVSQLQRPASVVALDEIRSAPDAEQATVRLDSGATATAHWSGQLGEAVLVASGLDRPDPDKTFELWFVRGDQPISAGVFDTVDGEATALLDGAMQAGDAIAVTVEQVGGSPSGAPTSDPIFVIPTA